MNERIVWFDFGLEGIDLSAIEDTALDRVRYRLPVVQKEFYEYTLKLTLLYMTLPIVKKNL